MIAMKELKTALSAGLNMVKGFCFNGILCDGWRQITDDVIEFRQVDRKTVRINVNDVIEIGTCKIYDERNGFNKPYPNVMTKEG